MKFAVFYPKPGFRWTNNKVVFLGSVVVLPLFAHSQEWGYYCRYIMTFLIVIWFFWVLYVLVMSFFEVEKLKGILSGFIIFEKDFIEVEEERNELESIKRIELQVSDYYGKLMNDDRHILNAKLSTGTANTLKLVFHSGDFLQKNFEIIAQYDMYSIKYTLIHYYLLKKISFTDLALALEDTSDYDQQELRKEIERVSRLQNKT